MPDIMMCDTDGCPKASNCHRNKASGTVADPHRQSYWMRSADSPVGDACDNFWEATPRVKAAHDGTF